MKNFKSAMQIMDERPIADTKTIDRLRIFTCNVNGGTSLSNFTQIRKGRRFLDGLLLTDIRLEASLSDQEDIDDLIELLKIAKFTLPKNIKR